ncbi:MULTISPECIES: hypothetical protein [unclassified Streptomyces]
MYRLAAEGVLPHTPSMYRHLSSHLAQARCEGRFPDLIDTLREVHVPPSWMDAGSFQRESADWFGLDRTIGQLVGRHVDSGRPGPHRRRRLTPHRMVPRRDPQVPHPGLR